MLKSTSPAGLLDLRREGAPPDVELGDGRVAVHAHDHNANLPRDGMKSPLGSAPGEAAAPDLGVI